MNAVTRQHWSDAQERILCGIAEPEDHAIVERQKIISKRKAAQELWTLAAILLFACEFVLMLSVSWPS